MTDDPRIRAMLDDVTARCATRPEFTHALSLEAAEAAIGAILWAYGSRPTDSSVIYAYDALYRALRIDWSKSNIVFLPADAANDPANDAASDAVSAGDVDESTPR